MKKRGYTHVKELLPAIHQMVAEGKTQREIAEYYGFRDKEVVKEALKRERRKEVAGIPKQRGRKPAKTLAEYEQMMDGYEFAISAVRLMDTN